MAAWSRAGAGWADDWTSALQRDDDSPAPLGGGCADDPLPPRMHYCSAAEQNEWESVLGRHEDAGAGSGGFAAGGGGGASSTRGATGPQMQAEVVVAAAAAAPAPVPHTAAEVPTPARGTTTPPGTTTTTTATTTTTTTASAAAVANGSDISSSSGGGREVTAGRALAGAFFSNAPRDAPRPPLQLRLALELGSHCTRAVLHDGLTELARLTYDSMLGQQQQQQQQQQPGATAGAADGDSSSSSTGGAGDGAVLQPAAVARTLESLRRVMAAATAAAAELAAAAAAGKSARTGAANAAAAANCAAQEQVPLEPLLATAAAQAAEAAGAGGRSGSRLLVGGPEVGGVRLTGRMVATAAVRSAAAASREQLAAAAAQVVGCPLEVLTGEEEGGLAWRGVVAALPPAAAAATGPGGGPPQLLVVDLGGRSTEFIHGSAAAAQAPPGISIPLGCVALHASAVAVAAAAAAGRSASSSSSSCSSSSSKQAADEGAAAAVQQGLEACVQLAEQVVWQHCEGQPWLTPPSAETALTSPPAGPALPRRLPFLPVFTGGTVTTVAALHLRLLAYERTAVHGCRLTSSDVRQVMTKLAAPGGAAAAMAAYGWLTPGRAETLAAGCAGLLGVLSALGVDEVVVSDSDLLDGLLESVLAAP
ncbi:hypothetical protein HYH02_009635 [Chlamydomonas schloesseri]|uniref:Ppx/GppA phosphatase N-terminal domain-containing protein n=1 Tax=Chlamydomonas schloesseri TaxID=2026947 RepID=A0A835TAY0_9CHLO|nr:hypothetical protein HYH02_009635 [Chlamydomonas schloesseri]|eukprot:KAG2442147.1 hypothetical protein HYH02_009635 [Chlamydomonas schloesseri]